MKKTTRQIDVWTGQFGKEYTDRNAHSIAEMNDMYIHNYGVTRTDMNQRFIGDLDRGIKILEVGSNVGNQLLCLQMMEFQNLYGIELQAYAVDLSKQRTKNINIIQGSAFDIPFKDGFFDLVFTSGVLIHIAPQDISDVISEIFRCTNTYIWGFEYYADTYTEVQYRQQTSLLWKANFSTLYQEQFPSLKLIKKEHFPYLNNPNIDSMFLLKRS